MYFLEETLFPRKDANRQNIKFPILCSEPVPAWMSFILTLLERTTISSLPAGHASSVRLTERISVHDVN